MKYSKVISLMMMLLLHSSSLMCAPHASRQTRRALKETSLPLGNHTLMRVLDSIAADYDLDKGYFFSVSKDCQIGIGSSRLITDLIDEIGKCGVRVQVQNMDLMVYNDEPYLKSYNLRDLNESSASKSLDLATELEKFVLSLEIAQTQCFMLKEDMIANISATHHVHTRISKWLTSINRIKRAQVKIDIHIVEIEKGSSDIIFSGIKKALSLGAISTIASTELSSMMKMASSMEEILKIISSIGEFKVIAKPSIIAMNMQQATIVAQDEYYLTYPIKDDSSDDKLTRKIPVGLELLITPLVDSLGREIVLKIEPTFTRLRSLSVREMSFLCISDENPGQAVTRKKSKTIVRVNDGELLVIGGLSYENTRHYTASEGVIGRILNRVGNAVGKRITHNGGEFMIMIKATILK